MALSGIWSQVQSGGGAGVVGIPDGEVLVREPQIHRLVYDNDYLEDASSTSTDDEYDLGDGMLDDEDEVEDVDMEEDMEC